MESIKLALRGVSPLLMQGDALVDPLNEHRRAIREFTKKKAKTDSDMLEIARLEWEAAMYFDVEAGPYMPGQNVDAMMRDAGRLTKRGKDILRGAMCVDDKPPLIYDGPRDIAGLWADPRFQDRRSVVVQRARTMRYRPIFRAWSLSLTIAYDEGIFDPADLRTLLAAGGRYIGLGTYRPRFGRFEVTG